MVEPLTAFSALGIFVNNADKLKGNTLNGIISELIDTVCDLYKINREKLIEFLSQTEIANKLDRIKKGERITFEELQQSFEEFCNAKGLDKEAKKALKCFLEKFEIRIAKSGLTDKITLQYLQGLVSGVESLEEKLSKVISNQNEDRKLLQKLVELVRSKSSPPSFSFSHNHYLYSGHGFELRWPETWEVYVSKTNLKQRLEEKALRDYKIKTKVKPPEIQIRTKNPTLGIHLAANAGSYIFEGSIDYAISIISKLYQFEQVKILDQYSDSALDVGSIITETQINNIRTITAQKFILRNKRLYILTINQLTESQLVENPHLFDELKEIAYSFKVL